MIRTREGASSTDSLPMVVWDAGHYGKEKKPFKDLLKNITASSYIVITHGKVEINFLQKHHQWIQKVCILYNLEVKLMWSRHPDPLTKKSSDDKDVGVITGLTKMK